MPRSAAIRALTRPLGLAAAVTLLSFPLSLPWLLPAARAAGLTLKPGLWEVRIVKQLVDGHDQSARITASLAQAQQALANVPPAQRARLQALMNQTGVSQGSAGSFRICVTAAMAQRDLPILDKDGRCRPVMVSHSGQRTRFEFHCTANGTTMNGTGQAVVTGDLVNTHTDVSTRTASGAIHHIQNETQMQYVSADCGPLSAPTAPHE